MTTRSEPGRPGPAAVTMVITSCRRFDLLERTLRSFLAINDYPLTRILIIEDSDDGGVDKVAALFPDAPIEIVVNGRSLRQLGSIDKAYGLVTTDYIFHCEDDWTFGRAGIIAESVAILSADPGILMVQARDESDMPAYIRSLRVRAVPTRDGGVARYRKVPPTIHHYWYTHSFNPGLRRLSDYKLLPDGYAPLGGEREISVAFKRLGYAMAWLTDGQVTHIGDERSTYGQRRRFDPFERLGIWGHSLRRRIAHYGRVLGIARET